MEAAGHSHPPAISMATRIRPRRSGVLVLLSCVALLIGFPAQAENVRTGGTGAALGTMRLLGHAMSKVDSQFALEVVPNLGSSGGLRAIDQGAIDFAVISRPLTSEEIARGHVAHEYGRTPFVLATARNDVGNLTLRQIADIYAGRIAQWPDGTPVRIVLRPVNDTDTALLASFSPGIKEGLSQAMNRPGMIVSVTDQDSANDIVRIKGALGTSSLALILAEKRPLFVVAIDGMKPTTKTIQDGSYPYYKPVYIVTRAKVPESVARFIAFTQSREGRRILAETGHWIPEPHERARAH